LRSGMKRPCKAKIHTCKKYLAVWHARRLVKGWATGHVWIGVDGGVFAMVEREQL
ncbi:hypothetical protein B0J13DRAFT_397882, partial [Dactylonectria estremocensis]